jgi:dTMP kinase
VTGHGERLAGYFLVVEGLDGSGKTSAARRLAAWLRQQGKHVVLTREPGGTALGERIRDLLLGATSSNLATATESLLFAAARSQLVNEVILPALQRHDVVICDRFADSSLAYQWGGRGMSLPELRAVQRLAVDGAEPDLKLLFDLPPAVAMARREKASGPSNRFDIEELAFHERVREAYLSLARADPHRWRIIDASRGQDEVWQQLQRIVIEQGLATHAGGDATGQPVVGELV